MSDLSDFKRVVYEPEVRALRARIAVLQGQLEELYSHAQIALDELDVGAVVNASSHLQIGLRGAGSNPASEPDA